MTKKINLKISGMHCKSCEAIIKMELEDLGITECQIGHKTGNAVIIFNENKTNIDQIKSVIKKQGYGVN